MSRRLGPVPPAVLLAAYRLGVELVRKAKGQPQEVAQLGADRIIIRARRLVDPRLDVGFVEKALAKEYPREASHERGTQAHREGDGIVALESAGCVGHSSVLSAGAGEPCTTYQQLMDALKQRRAGLIAAEGGQPVGSLPISTDTATSSAVRAGVSGCGLVVSLISVATSLRRAFASIPRRCSAVAKQIRAPAIATPTSSASISNSISEGIAMKHKRKGDPALLERLDERGYAGLLASWKARRAELAHDGGSE